VLRSDRRPAKAAVVNLRIRSAWLGACTLLGAACGGGGGGDSNGNSANSFAVLAGACIVNVLPAASLSNCTNLDAYAACATGMCDLESCLGPCNDFKSCVHSAADPCTNNCVQSTACQSCLAPVAACAANQCLETLTCGPIADGGACDKLAACCNATPANMKMTCQLLNRAARVGGDRSCQADLLGLAGDAGVALFACTP
jgi:hypothetical protein